MTSYLLAGPAIEPVTLSEAKAFCRVDDAAEDGLIATLIAAARLHVEGHTGRALIAQTWRLLVSCWPEHGRLKLPLAPVLSIAAVTAYDTDDIGHVIDTGQFGVIAGVAPAEVTGSSEIAGLPVLRPRHGLAIDYVAGYGSAAGDVPADLRQAILVLVGHWFENRDAALDSAAPVPFVFARLIAPYVAVRL